MVVKFLRKIYRKHLVRKNRAKLLPWYDSVWLSSYLTTQKFFQKKDPGKLEEFENQIQIFRTPKDFKIYKNNNWFTSDQWTSIRESVEQIKKDQLKTYELEVFGREILHNNPFFTSLQQSLCPRVAEIVGEPVEVSYNFLSLYGDSGQCPLHLDAPSAKWTLDICINSSHPWPIYFSPVIDWPDSFGPFNSYWQKNILEKTDFEEHTLSPREGIIFSGSSQWHFREPNPNPNSYCDLIFFHFIPKGKKDLSSPLNWPDIFETPSLGRHLIHQ